VIRKSGIRGEEFDRLGEKLGFYIEAQKEQAEVAAVELPKAS
jgi:hypothetical protein